MKQWNNGTIGLNPEKQHAYLFRIIGLVQGVFFRAETKRKADELGITGWVQNCPDGNVEIFAQGRKDALQRLEAWCTQGPSAARVTSVTREERTPESLATFTIRH